MAYDGTGTSHWIYSEVWVSGRATILSTVPGTNLVSMPGRKERQDQLLAYVHHV